MELMTHDSSADVRLSALAALAATKTTLPHILLKTRDVKVHYHISFTHIN